MKVVMNDGRALVGMSGRIDIDSSPPVRDRLLALLNVAHPNSITIDLSAVTHIDSSGVATLIEVLKRARAGGAEIKLHGLHDRLRTLFEVTGILALFNGSSNSGEFAEAV
jgi:anti-sigma B factor antagonist